MSAYSAILLRAANRDLPPNFFQALSARPRSRRPACRSGSASCADQRLAEEHRVSPTRRKMAISPASLNISIFSAPSSRSGSRRSAVGRRVRGLRASPRRHPLEGQHQRTLDPLVRRRVGRRIEQGRAFGQNSASASSAGSSSSRLPRGVRQQHVDRADFFRGLKHPHRLDTDAIKSRDGRIAEERSEALALFFAADRVLPQFIQLPVASRLGCVCSSGCLQAAKPLAPRGRQNVRLFIVQLPSRSNHAGMDPACRQIGTARRRPVPLSVPSGWCRGYDVTRPRTHLAPRDGHR